MSLFETIYNFFYYCFTGFHNVTSGVHMVAPDGYIGDADELNGLSVIFNAKDSNIAFSYLLGDNGVSSSMLGDYYYVIPFNTYISFLCTIVLMLIILFLSFHFCYKLFKGFYNNIQFLGQR